jgi:hypothetical protein
VFGYPIEGDACSLILSGVIGIAPSPETPIGGATTSHDSETSLPIVQSSSGGMGAWFGLLNSLSRQIG